MAPAVGIDRRKMVEGTKRELNLEL